MKSSPFVHLGVAPCSEEAGKKRTDMERAVGWRAQDLGPVSALEQEPALKPGLRQLLSIAVVPTSVWIPGWFLMFDQKLYTMVILSFIICLFKRRFKSR